MLRAEQVSLFDLVSGLSEAVDLVCNEMHEHQQKTAYISYRLGQELNLPLDRMNTLIIAATLHDIGALSLNERLATLDFEDNSQLQHQDRGYCLLKTFEPLKDAAEIIKYHHVRWNDMHSGIPYESHIVYQADRVAVLLSNTEPILKQKSRIINIVSAKSGIFFDPALVEAFARVANNDSFWFELSMPNVSSIVAERVGAANIYFNEDNLLSISQLFSRVIDFRSRFTATYSSGVAAVAKKIGMLCNLSYQECMNLEIAGLLHDIGKLSVPTEILEKAGPLTEAERDIIKTHAYYTYMILDKIKPLRAINVCACLHHEMINGKGYPFGFKGHELPLCSRIMRVADVFAALTEARPYRDGMEKAQIISALKDMAENETLDRQLTQTAVANYDMLHHICLESQRIAREEYERYDMLT